MCACVCHCVVCHCIVCRCVLCAIVCRCVVCHCAEQKPVLVGAIAPPPPPSAHTRAHTHTHTHTTLPCLHTPHLCQPPLFFQLPQVDVIARDALDSSAPQLQQAVALHALSALVAVSAASATAAPYSAGATTTSAPGVRGGAFGGELAASAVILHSRTGCTSK